MRKWHPGNSLVAWLRLVCFVHSHRHLLVVVHGDDFAFCEEDKELKWVTRHMEEWFEITVRATLGEELRDDKEVTILGRIVRWK